MFDLFNVYYIILYFNFHPYEDVSISSQNRKISNFFLIPLMMFDITDGFFYDNLLPSLYQVMVHCVTSIFLFATYLPNGFISKPSPLSVVENIFYHNNADLMQP